MNKHYRAFALKSRERPFARSKLIGGVVFAIILLSPQDLFSQALPVEPFTFETTVTSTLGEAQDALQQLAKLEGAIVNVQQGKEPHFGSRLDDCIAKINTAADALRNSRMTAEVPDYVKSPENVHISVGEATRNYVQQLRAAESKGAALRSMLRAKLTFTERLIKVAPGITKLYKGLVEAPLPETEGLFADDFVAAGQLELTLANFEGDLRARLNQLDRGLAVVGKQINSGEFNLTNSITSEMLAGIQMYNRERLISVAGMDDLGESQRDEVKQINEDSSINTRNWSTLPGPAPAAPNPYTSQGARPSAQQGNNTGQKTSPRVTPCPPASDGCLSTTVPGK